MAIKVNGFFKMKRYAGSYREFRRGGEDHDPVYIKFNERQQ